MSEQKSKLDAFIDYVLKRAQQDKKFSSEIRRSSNPAFEAGGWETLAQFGISLDYKDTRRAYLIVASAAVNSKIPVDGTMGLGRALAMSYSEKQNDEQGKARLRRLLSCSSQEDANNVVMATVRFVQSRKHDNLDYSKILRQLISFSFDPDRAKAQWATDFYSYGNMIKEESDVS